jgi:hypothetical protein
VAACSVLSSNASDEGVGTCEQLVRVLINAETLTSR